jgi:hypothetical protein
MDKKLERIGMGIVVRDSEGFVVAGRLHKIQPEIS